MKEKYREHCEAEPSVPIFSRDWWLDAVAGDDWDVAVVEKGGQIVATLPYVISKRLGMVWSLQPDLTQTLGPWLRVSANKTAKKLAQEKDLMAALIDQLPSFSHFSQNWHHARQNWLPFYWRGFRQTTRYTYILPDIGDEQKLWSELQSNIKTDIRKASATFNLSLVDDADLCDFLALNRKVFGRQGRKLPYAESLVERIDDACAKRNRRKLFIAQDDQGRQHAGVYLVWDDQSAYYLMGGGDPGLRNSGATSFCVWQAIKFAATVTRSFDFEGSMVEPVERFFRGFGAVQTPYFRVSKGSSRMLNFVRLAERIAKR